MVHWPFVGIFTDMLEHLGWDVGRGEGTFLHYNSSYIDSYLYNGYEKVHLGSVCELLFVSAFYGLTYRVEYIICCVSFLQQSIHQLQLVRIPRRQS